MMAAKYSFFFVFFSMCFTGHVPCASLACDSMSCLWHPYVLFECHIPPLPYHAVCDADIGKFQQRSAPDKRYTPIIPCTACVVESVAILIFLWFAIYLQELMPPHGV